jgi:hypothetical protein
LVGSESVREIACLVEESAALALVCDRTLSGLRFIGT